MKTKERLRAKANAKKPRLSKVEEFKIFLNAMNLIDGEIENYKQAVWKSIEYVSNYYRAYALLAPRDVLYDDEDLSLFEIQHAKTLPLQKFEKFPKIEKFVNEVIDQRRKERNFSENGIEKAKRHYVKLRFKKIHEELLIRFWEVSTDLFQTSGDEIVRFDMSDGAEDALKGRAFYWKGALDGKKLSGPGVWISHRCEVHANFKNGYAEGLVSVFNTEGKLFFQGFFDHGKKLMSIEDMKLYFSSWRRVSKSAIRLKNQMMKKILHLESMLMLEFIREFWWTWMTFVKRKRENRKKFEESPRHCFFVGRDTFIDILEESEAISTSSTI